MKFKIKVTCERAGYEGAFEVEAPHEGLAETRATQEAFHDGLKTRGLMPPPLIEYETLSAETDRETVFVKGYIGREEEVKELPASALKDLDGLISNFEGARGTKIYEEDPR